ncbi:hypothetical protein ACRRTK_012808 [Alexandromys fortis]
MEIKISGKLFTPDLQALRLWVWEIFVVAVFLQLNCLVSVTSENGKRASIFCVRFGQCLQKEPQK